MPGAPGTLSPNPVLIHRSRGSSMAATDAQQKPVIGDPLRHHKHYQEGGQHPSPYAGGSSFMERMAEWVASAMGTVQFVLIGSLIILGWVFINGAVKYFENTGKAIRQRRRIRSRAVDPAQPHLLRRRVLYGCAGNHRPEGTDEDRQGERGSRGEAQGRASTVSVRPAHEEHRPDRTDPYVEPEDEYAHRRGTSGYL